MKEIVVTHAVESDTQDEAPDGFVLWIGLDEMTTAETGVMHLIEFPIPIPMIDTFREHISHDAIIDIAVSHFRSFPETFLGIEVIFTQVVPVAVGIRQ